MKRALITLAVCALAFCAVAYAENYDGSPYVDIWVGTQNGETAHMNGGGDYANSGNGPDKVWGDGGADEVFGGGGTDTLPRGDGNHLGKAGCAPDSAPCSGSGADNVLVGDDGNDTLGADNGKHDTVSGGPGTDTCYVDQIDDLGIYGCENLIVDGH